MKVKKTLIQEAYVRCTVMRSELTAMNARCAEVTEDKDGILWERWILPNGRHAVLWATPHTWDMFVSATSSLLTADVIAAVRRVGSVNKSASEERSDEC